MNKTAYFLLRIAIGASMFGHGFVRIPKIAGFSKWMADSFSNSLLPSVIVVPFSYLLPFLEFAIGLLLILGLFTRQTLIAGCVVMILLIFGSSMIENWEAIPSQLIHTAFFAFLLHYLPANSIAIDGRKST